MKDVVSIPLYLAMIALNCVEIFLIGKKPAKKRLKSEKMLLSLSIGDVMLGLNGVIGFFREIKVIPSSRFIILFLNSFIIFSVTFSILHILLLTLDRFVSVYYPIRRRILMSDHFINISLVVIWLFSLISVPFIVWHSVAKKSAIYPVFLSIEVLPTLVFLFFVYVMIYRRLRGSVTLATSNCRTSMASSVNLSSVSYVYDDARNHNENEAVTTGGLSQPGVAVECNVALSSNGNSNDLKVSSIKLEQQEQNGGKDKTMSSTEMTESFPRPNDDKKNSAAKAEVATERFTTVTLEVPEEKTTIHQQNHHKQQQQQQRQQQQQQQHQQQQQQQQQQQPRRHSKRAYKQEQRILMLGISIIISFAICFLPVTITFLVFIRFTKQSMSYFVVAYFFAVLNSVSNPILYFFYRYWDKAKECCCCCC